jgi:Carboxypeptidase regulatory-like domain
VSGALVSVAGGWFAAGGPGARAAARTDATGHYRLEGLTGGPLRVSARRDETSPATTRGLMLEEGSTEKLDLVLVDGGVVAGMVIDARGNPIPGAVVARADGGGRGWRGGVGQVAADDAGNYLLSLPPGTYGLSAWRPERVLRFGVRPPTLATASITAGSRSQLDLVIPDDPPANLAGKILEPGGAPSAQASVRVATTSAGTLLLGADGEGAFTMSVPAGESVVVSARNGGRTGSLTVSPPVSDVVVQLQPAASVEGRLVGEPPPETFSLWASTTGAMRMGGGPSQLQFAGATFAVSDLAPGPIALHVQTEDGRLGDAQASVAAGESRKVDITLSPAGVVAGRLVDASTGQPVTRARISVDGMPRRVAIGPDGRFSKTLATGPHTLLVTAAGYVSLSRAVSARPDGPNDLGDLPLAPQSPAAPKPP